MSIWHAKHGMLFLEKVKTIEISRMMRFSHQLSTYPPGRYFLPAEHF
jgi:hypothetical protein